MTFFINLSYSADGISVYLRTFDAFHLQGRHIILPSYKQNNKVFQKIFLVQLVILQKLGQAEII